jgi:hypothetical protein
MKRRAAVEPVIGHLNAEHRIDHSQLKDRKAGSARQMLLLN